MGPQHGLIGNDANYGTDLPATAPPAPDISRERNMARFSKTKEFDTLKEAILARQAAARKYIPMGNGQSVDIRDLPNEERGWRWLAADWVITELQMIIDAYELANQVVEDAKAADKRRQTPRSATS